jgi:hypothetical protein
VPFVLGVAQIGDDEVLRLDVTVVDALAVTKGDGIAHLGKHARDELQAAVGKQLVGRQRGKERGGRRRRGRVGSHQLFVVAGLLEEVEKIFARDVLKDKEEVGAGLKSAIKSGNVLVSGQGLVNGGLRTGMGDGGSAWEGKGSTWRAYFSHLGIEGVCIVSNFAQTLDSIRAAEAI